MVSPFPGMDPYLERPHWGDFHATFIPCWRRAINDVLPPSYNARIDASSNLIEVDPSEAKLIEPDVAVVRDRTTPSLPRGESPVAMLAPVVRTLPMYREVKERWLTIIHEPDDTMVAVAEFFPLGTKGREPAAANTLQSG